MKPFHQNIQKGIVQAVRSVLQSIRLVHTPHRCKIKRKDYSKSDDDPGSIGKNNCANIKDVQCEPIGTGEVLSMCIVPVKVQNKNSDKKVMMFAMLETFSQGAFTTANLIEQLNISDIQPRILE